MESHARYRECMTLECQQFLARPHVPHFDRAVRTARGQPLSIRAKCNGRYALGVACKSKDGATVRRLPSSYGPVRARGGKVFAVGAERHTRKLIRMSEQGAGFLTRSHVP